VRGEKVTLGQRRPSRAVRGPADVQTFAWYRRLHRSCNSCRVKRVGRKRVRGPPRIFASGFDNFSSFRSAPMHMTLGPRRGASDQPRFRPAASAARYEAKAGFENERIRHRFERCKLRGASHGPRRACRAAQALDVQDGPSNIDFFSSEARASRKENLQLN
jgi:hypothetical protein